MHCALVPPWRISSFPCFSISLIQRADATSIMCSSTRNTLHFGGIYLVVGSVSRRDAVQFQLLCRPTNCLERSEYLYNTQIPVLSLSGLVKASACTQSISGHLLCSCNSLGTRLSSRLHQYLSIGVNNLELHCYLDSCT